MTLEELKAKLIEFGVNINKMKISYSEGLFKVQPYGSQLEHSFSFIEIKGKLFIEKIRVVYEKRTMSGVWTTDDEECFYKAISQIAPLMRIADLKEKLCDMGLFSQITHYYQSDTAGSLELKIPETKNGCYSVFKLYTRISPSITEMYVISTDHSRRICMSLPACDFTLDRFKALYYGLTGIKL